MFKRRLILDAEPGPSTVRRRQTAPQQITGATTLARLTFMTDYTRFLEHTFREGEGEDLTKSTEVDPQTGKWICPYVATVTDFMVDAAIAKPGLQSRVEALQLGTYKCTVKARCALFHPIQNRYVVLTFPEASDIMFHIVRLGSQFDRMWDAQTVNIRSNIERDLISGTEGSGWVYTMCYSIGIVVYAMSNPIGGACFIPTPRWLSTAAAGGHSAVVNPRNKNAMCGRYGLLEGRYYEDLAKCIQGRYEGEPPATYVYLRSIGALKGRLDRRREALTDPATYDLLDAAHAKGLFDDGKGPAFDWTGVTYPMSERAFDVFERNNPGWVPDVYYYHEPAGGEARRGTFGLWRSSPTTVAEREGRNAVRLLLLGKRNPNGSEPFFEEEEDNNHFVMLPQRGLRALTGSTAKNGVDLCPYCMKVIVVNAGRVDASGRNAMECHMDTHLDNGYRGCMVLPEAGSADEVLSFAHRPFRQKMYYERRLRKPYTIYADMETIQRAINVLRGERSIVKCAQEPATYCVKMVTPRGVVTRFGIDDDPAELIHGMLDLMHSLAEEAKEDMKKYSKKINKRTVPWDHYDSTVCHICRNRQHEGFEVLDEREKEVVDDYKERNADYKAEQNDKDKYLTHSKYIDGIPEEHDRDFARAVFAKAKYILVEDHDDLTGIYRGPAHSCCNLAFTYKKAPIDVFFHNLSGFDGHLILQYIRRRHARDTIRAIPTSSEKYKAFRQGDLEFKDSCASLGAPLQECVEVLAKYAPEKLVETMRMVRRKLEGSSEAQIQAAFVLVCRKGTYPYDKFTSLAFLEEKELPGPDGFVSGLTKVCNQGYEDDFDSVEAKHAHALAVWKAFGCRKMLDYHMLYQELDVAQLHDCYEAFRDGCLADPLAPLDPAWFYGTPGLSYDAMLFMRETLDEDLRSPLRLMTDQTHVDFIIKNKRGGLVTDVQRTAYANDPRMGSKYDPTKPRVQLSYVDFNNLYGWAMKQALPIGNYAWLTPEQLAEFTVAFLRGIPDDAPTGYYVEVKRLFAPREVHKQLDEYPGVPEFKTPTPSEFMKKYAPGPTCPKLIMDLVDKHDIGLHYRLLKELLDIGWEVDGINRVLSFDQEPWLAKYIDHNTAYRKLAKTKIEQDVFKLKNNAIFGKMIEDPFKRIAFQPCFSGMQFKRLVHNPMFNGHTEFNDELFGVHMKQQQCEMNAMAASGVSILDIAKVKVIRHHYKVMKPRYGDAARLVYSDTDSMLYEIVGRDFYADLRDDPEFKAHFDCSEMHPATGLCDKSTAKVVGLAGIEHADYIIAAFAAPKVKTYACKLIYNPTHATTDEDRAVLVDEALEKAHTKLKLRADGEWELKKAKSIKKTVVMHETCFEEYEGCIDDMVNHDKAMCGFVSTKHQVDLVEVKKRALCCYEDKRDYSDATHSHAYGYNPL